ncbi:hypothetical protein UF75_3295 [Desulfosporosinus sp. I2]|nr:hypothetical protein UF75_3295 [Desulfosporosinus sp. I2]
MALIVVSNVVGSYSREGVDMEIFKGVTIIRSVGLQLLTKQ